MEKMKSKLTKKDIDLLKKYFNKDNHGIIERNKDTPISVLKMMSEIPFVHQGFIFPLFIALIMFTLLVIYTFLNSDGFKAFFNFTPNNLPIGFFLAILSFFILCGALYFLVGMIIKSIIKSLNEIPLLYKFLIILRKDDEDTFELSEYLETYQNMKKDSGKSRILSFLKKED